MTETTHAKLTARFDFISIELALLISEARRHGISIEALRELENTRTYFGRAHTNFRKSKP